MTAAAWLCSVNGACYDVGVTQFSTCYHVFHVVLPHGATALFRYGATNLCILHLIRALELCQGLLACTLRHLAHLHVQCVEGGSELPR